MRPFCQSPRRFPRGGGGQRHCLPETHPPGPEQLFPDHDLHLAEVAPLLAGDLFGIDRVEEVVGPGKGTLLFGWHRETVGL